YVLTTSKGDQVADAHTATSQFKQLKPAGDTSPMRIAFNSDGQGWGQQFVVETIPVTKNNGKPAFLSDLKVADFLVDGSMQPVIVAVGEEVGLVIANPFSGAK